VARLNKDMFLLLAELNIELKKAPSGKSPTIIIALVFPVVVSGWYNSGNAISRV